MHCAVAKLLRQLKNVNRRNTKTNWLANFMYSVAALYRFQTVLDPETLAAALRATCAEHEICGTLILASEGINGTIAAA